MQNLISWNFTNWLTVILMVTLGYVIIGFAGALVRKGLGNADASA